MLSAPFIKSEVLSRRTRKVLKFSARCGVLGREFAVSHDKRLYGTLVDCYESIMQASREALLSLNKGGLGKYTPMRSKVDV